MKTKECYFQISVHPQNNYCPVSFILNQKEIFDKQGFSKKMDNDPEDLPKGFNQMSESCYEYIGLPSEGRKKLLDSGAIEVKMVPDNADNLTVAIEDADRCYNEHQGSAYAAADYEEDGYGEAIEEDHEMEEAIEEPEDLNNRADVLAYQQRLKEDRIRVLKEDLNIAINAEAFLEAAKIRDLIKKEEET